MDLDKIERKIDLILDKLEGINIQTAVQEEKINRHGVYFRWTSGFITSIMLILISTLIRVVL